MEASRRTEDAHAAGVREGAGRTLAQTTCLALGAVLVAAGVLGFFFGGSNFDTGGAVRGEEFIVFEVNGWHNIVHIATGLALLLAAVARGTAKAVALTFAVVYIAVTIIGFLDGDDVLGVIPVNAADNFLHAAIAAVGLVAALVSPADNRPSATK